MGQLHVRRRFHYPSSVPYLKGWELSAIDAGDNLEGIDIVHLPQYLIWKIYPIEFPEGVIATIVIKILIGGFKGTPVERKFFRSIRIFSEE